MSSSAYIAILILFLIFSIKINCFVVLPFNTIFIKDKTIFKLLVKKKSNREIAEILNVDEKTIRNRKSAMKKFILEGLRKNYENFN